MMVAQHILDRGEGTIMAYRWPEETVFTRLVLTVEEPWCRACGGALTICDHRHHRVFTLNGPVHLVCKLARLSRARLSGSAQFIAVCRRSKKGSMGTRKPGKGLRLCKR
jgi:hypothetical protein